MTKDNNNDEDYIPGVTPWHKPTEKELGFKPLSDEEFEKVKEKAAETKEERWKDIGWGKTPEEFDSQLSREKDWLRHFEHADNEPLFPTNDMEPPPPGPLISFKFDDIVNFFKGLFGGKN